MQEQTEFLLELSSAKVERLERALEKNWIAHLILAGLGLAFVFDIGDLPKSFAKYFSQDQYNTRLGAVIILPVVLYYFMRFGHLLTSFVAARSLHDALLSAYLGDQFDQNKFRPLRESTSFFEVFYSTHLFRARGPVVLAFTVTPAVISVAQAAALFLLLQAYGRNTWSIAVLVLSGTILMILYWAFWKSQKSHPGTTGAVIGCVALIIAWFIAFAVLAPNPAVNPDAPKSGAPVTLMRYASKGR
jgi:hypothetical protein